MSQLDLPLTVSIVSAIVSSVAVIIASYALRKQTLTIRLDVFESCFERIIGLEKEYYTTFADKNDKEKSRWDSLFFNAIELLSFYANEKYLGDKKLINFFAPAIVDWYENIFLKTHTKETIDDPKCYPEMKKLYKNIKSNSY